MRALLLLAALTASAAEPAVDPSAPGFWTKTYTFSGGGCSASLRAIVPDAPAALKRLARLAGEGSNFDGATSANWEMEPSAFAKSKSVLLGLGEIQSYSEYCASSAEAYPELDYKRDVLAREKAASAGALADLPAVSGLLDAELETLDRMIQTRDQSRLYQVHVEVLGRDQASAEGSGVPRARVIRAHKVRRVDQRAGPSAVAQWGRNAIPACERFPVSIMGVPRGELERWKKSLLKGGAEYRQDGCHFGRNGILANAAVWVDPARLDAVKEELMKSGRMTRWDPETPTAVFFAGLSSADKSERLTAELDHSADSLKDAPNIRALVRSELDRIGPVAFNETQGRTRRLVYLAEGEGETDDQPVIFRR